MKIWAAAIALSALLPGSDAVVRPDPFLKIANEITYEAVAKISKEGTHRDQMVVRIKNVEVNGTHVHASAMMAQYSKNKEPNAVFFMDFACDSATFYVDAKNWLYRSVETYDGEQTNYQGDSLRYPLNMKVGDSLPDAYASKQMKAEGRSSASTITFSSRKVISLDTLDLNFGKTAAYRIDMSIKNTFLAPVNKSMDYAVTEWFSPSLGVVKTQYDLGKGEAVIIMKSYTH